MAGLIYYDITIHDTVADILEVLKTIPNFWDEIGETTLIKGGITLTLSTQGTSMSGYGSTISLTSLFANNASRVIAATAKGLVIYCEGSGRYQAAAIGCDTNGNWGGCTGAAGSSGSSSIATVGTLLAENLTSTSFESGTVVASAVNTQIIDLAADKGNFIFDDLRRVLQTPLGIRGYSGKLTMPNGEKYVKCGAFALRYTE